MIHEFTQFQDLQNYVNRLQIGEQRSGVLFIGADFQFEEKAFDDMLNNCQYPIVGGIFPEVIFKGNRSSTSAVLLELDCNMDILCVDDFEESHIQEKVESKFSNDVSSDTSFLIFIDALLRNKPMLFDIMYNMYGSLPNYLGGGTGKLDFLQHASTFCNKGLKTGAAFIAKIEKPLTIGVSHGWEAIKGPFKVTEANGNEIISLDWKPAFEVYKEIIEEHANVAFNMDDFFGSTKSYPFGIKKLNNDTIVRDPFKTENGKIYLLDDVDEGSFVSILFGNIDQLLGGAKMAKQKTQMGNHNEEQNIIIDCISRVLFMGDDFKKEMEILDPNENAIGALTLGEIANDGNSYLEIYNKTVVVATLNG